MSAACAGCGSLDFCEPWCEVGRGAREQALERERHALANRATALGLWAESALEYLRVDEQALREAGCADAAAAVAELVAEGEAALRAQLALPCVSA